MAFIKMSNPLGNSIIVPQGAVEAYKGLGFIIEDETSVEESTTMGNEDNGNEVEKSGNEVAMSEDEQFANELEKKPIAQWSKEEVKKYAAICGVDISGTKNAQEAKERIKAFIDEKTE